MIRVNLLPQKRTSRRRRSLVVVPQVSASGQTWLLFVAGALIIESVGLLVLYTSTSDEWRRLVAHNQELTNNIDVINQEVANHTGVKSQLKDLRDREEAIQKLQNARSGPTGTMLELSRILTVGRGPTLDRDRLEQLKRDNPSSIPNANWDPRRLWIQAFTEKDRVVKVGGSARDGEDVSEFLRRLTLSDYFYEVKLLPATKGVDPQTKLELVKFEMSAKVRY